MVGEGELAVVGSPQHRAQGVGRPRVGGVPGAGPVVDGEPPGRRVGLVAPAGAVQIGQPGCSGGDLVTRDHLALRARRAEAGAVVGSGDGHERDQVPA